MQDVNNDMDGLLRRAADGYPLNTDSADWNKVLNALNASENMEAGDSFTKQKKYPNILLLVLLLSIPLIVADHTFVNNHNLFFAEAAKKNSSDLPYKTLHNHANTATKANYERSLSFPKSKNKNNNPEGTANKKESGSNNEKISKNELAEFRNDNKKRNKEFPAPPESLNKPESLTAANNTVKSNDTDGPGIEPSLSAAKGDFKNTSDTIVSNKFQVKKVASSNPNKNKRLYIGILAGPDISTVKFQSVNKTGFSAGLITGYALSKKLAIETGLLWDKKFYYTDGKYFNPKYFSIPSFINIDDVDGSCSMIEWPVNLYYTIKTFHKSFLTANAGISSYFMKNENYSYTFQRNGVENEWDLAYKNSSNNLFSVVNIGAGYNHGLAKSLLLRIQPYIKIPISGIGMGRLPITSSGVYIVFSRRIQ